MGSHDGDSSSDQNITKQTRKELLKITAMNSSGLFIDNR